MIALFLIPINVLGFMLNKQEKERQGDAYLVYTKVIVLIAVLNIMTIAASIGPFLGTELFWLMSTLEQVQAFSFFMVIYLFYSIESENNLTYSQIELKNN